MDEAEGRDALGPGVRTAVEVGGVAREIFGGSSWSWVGGWTWTRKEQRLGQWIDNGGFRGNDSQEDREN